MTPTVAGLLEIPPHNIEAEQALLGAILINNDAMHRVANFLEPAHFFEPAHRKIYEVSHSLIFAGKLATPITLRSYFPADVEILGLTVPQYLARVAAEATTIVNAPDYAHTVRELANRRGLLALAEDLIFATGSNKDAAETATAAIEALDLIASDQAPAHSSRIGIGPAATEAVRLVCERMANPSRKIGLLTGIADLDRKLGGLSGGQLVIVAARPGMGKSALAAQASRDVARDDNAAVLFFSLEMTAPEIAERLIANDCYSGRGSISYSSIHQGAISEKDAERVVIAERALRDLPLLIDPESGLSVNQIASRARRYSQQCARRGQKLVLVVVDHLQLIQPSSRYAGNRNQELTETTGALKRLAKELDCPVVALSQLSRQVENRDNKRPQLSDLRDSGSIEQDADIVLLMYREGYYLTTPEADPGDDMRRVARLAEVENRLEINVAKNRGGPTGSVDLFCDIGANVIASPARNDARAAA